MNYAATVAMTVLIGASLSVLLAPRIIPALRNLKIGQTIREDGPKSHLTKTGTPTMGGIVFIFAFILSSVLVGNLQPDSNVVIISTLAFGCVGFMDDYIKVVKKRNLGLRAYQKIIGQIMASAVIIIYVFYISGTYSSFYFPGLGQLTINMGVLAIPFFLLVILGTVNAVNLTDGLDGLAAGVSIIVFTAFGVMNNILGNQGLVISSASMAGALAGFLLFNYKPAKVFMGDTGSLALGGALASMAIVSGMTFYIPIVAGIFFAETISVIIQVAYFKLTGKRFFKMAPLHHHYEQNGWSELKVVWTFWTVSVLLAIAGLLLF